MKRLFWVNCLVSVVLLLCISCTTLSESDKNELASTAITLADKYCSNGEYNKAIKVYNRADFRSADYRYDYNKILILVKTGNTKQALNLCQKSFKKYGKIEFLTLKLDILKNSGNLTELEKTLKKLTESQPDNETYIKELYETIKLSDKTRAYNYILSLWESGKHTLFVAELLYSEKPEEWKVTYLALGGKIDKNEDN